MQQPEKIRSIFNRWQFAAYVAGARRSVHIAGRGAGKTFLLGGKTQLLAKLMPRGLFFICADTFDRIRNSTAPAMLTAWDALGWREYDPKTGGHYVINKRPPDHWPKPAFARLSPDNTIFTYTGAGFKFISQAAKNARGQSFDGGVIDEGLTLRRSFIDNDLIPVLRGNKERFTDCPLHYSISTVSSMPWDASGEYLLESAKYYEEDNKGYAELHARLPHLYADFLDAQTQAEKHRIWNYEILPLQRQLLYYISKHGVYYSQATVFDNLQQFSWATLKDMWRSIDRTSFMIEFLNMRYEAIGDQFYYMLNEAQHCYDADDVDRMNELGLITSVKQLWLPSTVQSSVNDKDVDPDRPLDMSGDWQASIIPLVIGQKHKVKGQEEYRVLKDFFVKSPKWVNEAIDDFADYYKTHRNKTVRFVHDHTAKIKYNTDKSILQIVKARLQSHGWRMVEVYIGKQPEHEERFKSINTVLAETGGGIKIRFNRKNTQTLRLAMRCTTVTRSTSSGFSKDKSKERSANFPQERTTHFTDSFDTIILQLLKAVSILGGTGYLPPVVTGR